jgi:hypothetical protein
MRSAHPEGGVTATGCVARKSRSGCGIQANQNVPICVVPVSVNVIVYWNVPGVTSLAAIVAETDSLIGYPLFIGSTLPLRNLSSVIAFVRQ